MARHEVRASASGGSGSPAPKGRIIDTKQSPLRPQRINTKNKADFCPQYPRRVFVRGEKIPIFAVLGLHSQADISESVFAFVLSRECGNFKTEGRRTALISCLDVGRDAFFIPISHIYSSVGYCIVYFCLGFVRTFFEINENRLHTFFLPHTPNPPQRSRYGNRI